MARLHIPTSPKQLSPEKEQTSPDHPAMPRSGSPPPPCSPNRVALNGEMSSVFVPRAEGKKHIFNGTGKLWKPGSGQTRIPVAPHPLLAPRQDTQLLSGHGAGGELRNSSPQVGGPRSEDTCWEPAGSRGRVFQPLFSGWEAVKTVPWDHVGSLREAPAEWP